MTNRKFLSLLLALFMVLGTVTPMFAENDSVTVLPPRMAEKEEPDNIVIMEGDKDTIPTLEESGEGGKKIEETLEEPEIKEDNSPVILENREENNNIVILPPIKNEENEEGITEPSKETVEPEEPKKEKENKREVKVQILSKRDAKKPASEGEVNLILLNDNPADINEEVYDEKIRWKESDFKIEEDKILGLSDEGLLKVARNKKLEIPEMENITIIEKEAFKGLSLRSVEIPKNIKEIKDDAFKDNHLKSVKILGKGKEISKNAFNEELVEMYGKCEKEEFLYECEDELEIGEKIVGDALGAVAPDDVSLYTFSGTTITGLSEKGKTYYTDNHNMILPGRNPQGQAITEIGGNAFSNKWRGYGLRSVDFSKCTSLTNISYNAFYNNQITNLDLSRCTHLTNIRDDAFKQNHITSLDLSKCTGLTSIGDNAFESNELTSLNLSGCKNLKSIGINAFYSNQITNLDMSGCTSLTIVRGYAFSFNQLTSIDLSECTSLTSIGWNVFRGNQLTSLDLSECTSLTSIGDNTFVSNQLKTAKIPLSLKNLADNSFKDNPGSNDKKQVYLYTPDKTNPNNLQDSDFHLINPITGPDDVSLYTFNGTTITGLSEKGKTYYTNNHNMVLPGKNPQGQAITAIGEGAFQHNRLSSLDFSRCTSLTTIGSYAFCSNFLLALDLSGCTSLTNIGHYAFRDNKLKTAKIPLSLSILSEFAFKDNPGNNYNKQVYLFTPDYTNPNNLRGSSYHLINPAEGIYDVSLYTFSGTTITGLSEKGKTYYATNHNMILPGKNPRGQAVTAIESGAFYNGRKGYGLTSVNFSYCTSLTSIGNGAFKNNQFTSLDLSKCTKLKNIGDYAFNKNKLTNLDLSRCTRLASIGEGAFYENQLTSLDLSRCTSLTNIGPGAFYQNKLTSLDLSRCTSLTSIGPTAFCRNQLTSLDLSGCTSLTSIGISAFTSSKLKTAKIPLSLSTLADNTFKDNPGNNDKKQVYLYTPDYTNPNNLKDTDYHLINPVESSDDVSLYTFNGATITGLSERGKKYYETHHDMKLPGKNPQGQAITAIGEKAFYNNSSGYGLTSVDFKSLSHLTSINAEAFANNNLTSLDLSRCINLTNIGWSAFYGNQLTTLNLSRCTNLSSIGQAAFCRNQLTSLDLSRCTNLLSIGSDAFGNNQLASLNLSECTNLTSIGRGAFYSNQLTSIDLSGCINLASIEGNAFIGNQIASLDLSECTSLTNIGDRTFNFNKLKTAKIPLSLTTLADDAFGNNLGSNKKNQVYLYTPDYTNPNNLKDTDYHLINPITGSDDVSLYTFNDTTITGLSERGKKYFETHHDMKLPGKNPQGELITAIGENAFCNNWRGYGLTSVDFSKCTSLKSIGNHAFQGNKLSSLDLSGCTNLTSIGDYAFEDNKLSSLDLSGCTNLTSIGDYAFYGNRLTSLDLSGYKGLANIGISAFEGNQLTNLDLSGCTSLTSINKDAFKYNQLTDCNLSGCTSLASIDNGAFNNNQLTSLNLSGCKNLTSIGYSAFFINNLTNLDLSECTSLASIDSYAFYKNQLKTAKIPLSLRNLADDAFPNNPGNNDKKQVYLYTPDYTNPNNLKDTDFHLINPITGSDDVSLYTFNGTMITGLSERGKKYFETHHDMKLPGKNPQGQAITVIEKKAFYNNGSGYGLTSVDFSNCTSLASIDYIAFSKNQLVSLDLSKCTSLTSIGNGAFMFNQLTSIDLSECESLKNIDSDAFSNNQLTSVDLSACTSLTSVGRYAFYTNVIKTGKIPLSLTNLADNAFQNNSGSNANHQVYLYTPDYTNPNNLPDTGYHLINPITGPDDLRLFKFDGTKLTGLTALGLKYYKEHHNMLLPAKNLEGEYITEITDSAFNGKDLKSVDFSNCSSLAKIGPWAFANNYIANLDLSPCQNLKIIAEHAFDNSHINKIDLSNLSKLETIEKEAFNSNQSTSLTFKNNKNLKNIGKFAFNQNQLTALDLSGCPNLLNIEEGVFSGGNIGSIDLSVVPNISFIGRAAFSDNQITSVNLSGLKNLKSIGEIAFVKNKITNLDLSPCENLEEIGKWSFSENGLNSINFKGLKNLKTIKYGAFMVNNLTSVDLSDCANLVNLEEAVFYKNKIKSLDMSKCISLRSIPGWIFGENQLKTAKIPSSITSIDESSFANNPGNNAKKQVYLYTPRRNNPMNLKDTDYHLVDPITFIIKKVDAKGKPMEGVEFAFYKVDRPTPPAPPAPPQNGTSRTDDTELEISPENISPAVGGITMPDIELNLNPEGPRPEFFPDPKTVVGVKPIFMTATTDKNGKAEITLPYSPYFLAENKTIPGYSINNTVTQIDATIEGKTITYTDYEVSIEVPKTGTLGIIPYILLAFILVCGAYVVLRKKKEEK